MSILVTAATGTVGSRVVSRLLAAREAVSALTHSPEKLPSLPRGVRTVLGDLTRPATLGPAFSGVEQLCLITPASPTEAQDGCSVVRAAARAGVRHIAFLSIHQVERAPHIPHFGSKIEIEQAIRDAGIACTVIAPNNFFQNDFWFHDAIVREGIYPQPIGGVGLSRIDADDIADALVRALKEPAYAGGRYPLVGEKVLTGDDVADAWSRHLDRPVRYAGDSLGPWHARMRTTVPEWLLEDWNLMFLFFQSHGLAASPEELAQQARILGRAPKSFESFVAQTATLWRNQA